ncbi:hypothetical protein B9Z55_006115 [Caenorhabditis nigoni]|uniref:Uncharacterized protein n=1 Tax=Caenorhabditis nigoni TaxID=1611254 RepID=A0A2G5V3Q7_9PELO|nr:hypothetical protein B9Z55_006115 [Caenorhabditis nigoni]
MPKSCWAVCSHHAVVLPKSSPKQAQLMPQACREKTRARARLILIFFSQHLAQTLPESRPPRNLPKSVGVGAQPLPKIP